MEQGQSSGIPYEILGDGVGVVWLGQEVHSEQRGVQGNSVGQGYRSGLSVCAV